MQMRWMTLAAVTLAAMSPPAWAGPYADSPAAKIAKKKGRTVVREVALDMNGDGKDEIAVVEKQGDNLRLVLLRATGAPDDEDRGFATILELKPQRARRVIRLEPMRLVGRTSPELVAVIEEPSPDDSALTVIVVGADGGPHREMFRQTFFIPKNPPKEDNVVAFGDATPHYVVEDLDGKGDGDKEIVWTREGQKLRLTDGAGDPVTFVIGAYRTIYRYDENKGVYRVAEDREVVDFLPPKTPYEVKASAQVKEIWGTAQAFWGTDGDLTTAWGVDRKGAVGQSLTVKLERREDVNLIRVVPGCAADAEAWETHDRVRKMKFELGSGVRFEIDTDRLTEVPDAVRAVQEFPLAGGFGTQVLIFLKRTQALPWAKVEIQKVERSRVRRKDQKKVACIAEISFH
ncbi:MAG: hypothetical protein RIT81_47565 [Deltaproteobacteria bacterium]